MNIPDMLFEYLKNMLYAPEKAHLDLTQLPADYQKLGEGMILLERWIRQAREFSLSMAKGDLSYEGADRDNIFVSPMKELQSTLRHLAWQTQQVANGDYSQTVDFMGEFSEGFNRMTGQLQERQKALIEEKKQAENYLYQIAYADALTGVYNRRYAMEQMNRWIREGQAFVLSFVDVDYLKYCNDTRGHKCGDFYLIEVAKLLQTLGGMVCRLGGDEFVVLDTEKTVPQQNQELEKRRLQLQESGEKKSYPKSFSYASCLVPANPEKSLDEYVSNADAMMYKYKQKYRKPLEDLLYKDNR